MSILTRLIEAGVDSDIIEEVALLIAEKRVADAAIEKRRANDRERTNRRRCNVTSRDTTGQTVTERDPSLSLPPNEKISNPPTHTHPDNKHPRVRGPAKPEGVQDQTWLDFLDLRKRKRATVTETVVAGIKREAERAGWTLEAALAETVTRGWQSFKAEFVETSKPPGRATEPASYLDHLIAKKTAGAAR